MAVPRPRACVIGSAFRVLGTTEDVTDCQCCGRRELKGTVVLQPLDPDGGAVGEEVYFGTTCAAKSMGQTVRYVREQVDAAKLEQMREQQRAANARFDAYCAWLTRTYGPKVRQPADLFDIGVMPMDARRRYRAEGGEP